jgi:hypothetical protein
VKKKRFSSFPCAQKKKTKGKGQDQASGHDQRCTVQLYMHVSGI